MNYFVEAILYQQLVVPVIVIVVVVVAICYRSQLALPLPPLELILSNRCVMSLGCLELFGNKNMPSF